MKLILFLTTLLFVSPFIGSIEPQKQGIVDHLASASSKADDGPVKNDSVSRVNPSGSPDTNIDTDNKFKGGESDDFKTVNSVFGHTDPYDAEHSWITSVNLINATYEDVQNPHKSDKELNRFFRALRTPSPELCKFPPDKVAHAHVVCARTWNETFCSQWCLFGHKLHRGVSRSYRCEIYRNVWRPEVEKCHPYIDCTFEITSQGFYNCTYNEKEMKKYCEFACGEFQEYTPSPPAKYVCDKTSQWIPHILPHCIAAGSQHHHVESLQTYPTYEPWAEYGRVPAE